MFINRLKIAASELTMYTTYIRKDNGHEDIDRDYCEYQCVIVAYSMVAMAHSLTTIHVDHS